MRCSSSAALATSRSAIRRLRSAAENAPVPVPGVCVVLRSDDMTFLHPALSGSYQRAGVAGNHQILVGLDDIGGDTASRHADAPTVLAVGCLVELQAQPAACPADGAANRYRILADAGGKDDAVDASERSRERADLTSRAVIKHLERKACERLPTRQELTEIR